VLKGLEDLLEIVRIEVSRLVNIRGAAGSEFQIVGAARLKLWAPNEQWWAANWTKSRSVFSTLTERTEYIVPGVTCCAVIDTQYTIVYALILFEIKNVHTWLGELSTASQLAVDNSPIKDLGLAIGQEMQTVRLALSGRQVSLQ